MCKFFANKQSITGLAEDDLVLKKNKSNLFHIGCNGQHKDQNNTSLINKYKELILSGATGVLWFAGVGLHYFGYAQVATLLWLIAYLPGGVHALIDAISLFLRRKFSIESLMIFAAIGAGFLGKVGEGALLLFLFSLGHALEHFALNKAKRLIKSLTAISPQKALVKLDSGQTTEVLVDDLVVHQIVIVKPGQLIPCDGVVINGSSSVDQSAITGESIPVSKELNDTVFAGTKNSIGVLEISVTKIAEETVLFKMIRLITEADAQKSKIQVFAEKFEQIFVPIVLISILLIIVIPPLLGVMSISQSIYKAIIILVAASPCALAIATPVAVLVGISRAARDGILIKGGGALESLGSVKVIAFDKTGTLTKGKPLVTDIVTFNNYTVMQLLPFIYGLELGSVHPLATAVIDYCKLKQVTPYNIINIQSFTGRGLGGWYNDELTNTLKPIYLGNHQLFSQNLNIQLGAEIEAQLVALERLGLTTVVIMLDGVVAGLITVADQLRESVANIMLQLKQLGVVQNVMLTGDNQIVANSIGAAANMDKIYANLLPADKLERIKELTRNYGSTAMVGDGVNDAPAMAGATVGVAMGGSKMDVAIETANIVLMNDKLNQLPLAFKISKKTQIIIKQNIFISLGVIASLVSLGLFSVADMGLIVLIHEGSTLVVIFNALRIFKIKNNGL